jgi:hypothetical protein
MGGLFGGYSEPDLRNETKVERLERELSEAREEIARLRRKLGSNHPDGYRSGIFG